MDVTERWEEDGDHRHPVRAPSGWDWAPLQTTALQSPLITDPDLTDV